ncbi:MAG TPA: 1-acyl-sn-glycerol-3-phosphate acyltransferase [Isosphaeraceae bacterium]|jgi:1-acyl-sn-glycerol-3-phosphate acyltransferase|nr:1-acyl-sn-glycerol-3-phosphate acyltransferase [Isosphaeraceae bacterium]
MRRLPLSDQLPYAFRPPRVVPLLVRLARPIIRRKLRREQLVHEVEAQGAEPLREPLEKGDGLLIAPNHADNADGGVMFLAAGVVGRPFCYMVAYQLFNGLSRYELPWLGAFPVDREGSDLRAFKAGVEVLASGRCPLVVFPEGEVYHTADRLTPLRDGAAALAIAAARRRAEGKGTVRIVPTAIKYRFLDGHDPTPPLRALMDELEGRFTWWPRTDRDLVARIYGFAEAMLALKELEYLGEVRRGPIPERLRALRSTILDRIEGLRLGRHGDGPVPGRVKELRHACLEALADPATTPEGAAALRRDLNDLFVVVQLYSYPGDYVAECPTAERVSETLLKFRQDVFNTTEMAAPRTPRRAIVRFGAPIDVAPSLAGPSRPRAAASALTAELEHGIQSLLDALGPGRPLSP